MKLREIKVGLMLLLPWQEAWAAEAFSFKPRPFARRRAG